MSHFGEMTNYFEDFGGNFEVFVGAIKEEVRIEANHAEGPLTKVLQMVTENRLLAGAAAAIGVLSVAFFFRDRLNFHNVYSENIGLKKENGELKEKVKSLEVELQSLNAKMETLEGKLESAGLMCVICQDHALNSTFVPCGHAVCDQCAKKMKRCPFCNHNVEQIIARY